MKTYTAYLGIGSNLGDRHKYLQHAVRALSQVAGVRVVWTSSVYETDPVGNIEQPKFLNAIVEVETSLAPEALFADVKRIERDVGRSNHERWAPREIDVDILLYDGLVHDSDTLKVPHPELPNRKFVLVPLREIAPDLVHPISGLTVTELGAACRDQSRVVKTAYKLFV